MIDPYKKDKDINIMIWDTIYENERSDIVLMKRDPNSNKSGYSFNSYLVVLRDQISQVYESSRIFIQDNVLIYTIKKVKKWFEDEEVELLKWSLYSPDLNSIEHL